MGRKKAKDQQVRSSGYKIERMEKLLGDIRRKFDPSLSYYRPGLPPYKLTRLVRINRIKLQRFLFNLYTYKTLVALLD